jgi:hypothetical protein
MSMTISKTDEKKVQSGGNKEMKTQIINKCLFTRNKLLEFSRLLFYELR